MPNRLRTFILGTIAISLMAILALPSSVKLYHAFFEHQEFICESTGNLHIHEVEIDCDFEDFNPSPQFYFIPLLTTVVFQSASDSYLFGHYVSLNSHQDHPFLLRGPPFIS